MANTIHRDRHSTKHNYETIISSIAKSVHQSIELQDVLENAVQSLSENVYNVDIAGVYLIEGTNAILRAYRGFDKQYIEGASIIPYPKGFTWKTIIEKRVIYCPDVENDTVIGKAGRKLGTKSYVSMPIKSEGLIVGTITINSLKINAFNEDELNLLQEVAQQIELAVNNASRTEALIKSGAILKKAKEDLEAKVEENTKRLEEANRELEQRVKFTNLISELSMEIYNLSPDEIDEGINKALKKIGEFAGVDRSYIFLYRDNETLMDNTHEWCAPGIESEIENLQGLKVEMFPWLTSKHWKGDIVNVPRVSDMPPEAKYEREELEREGIKSLINLALVNGDARLGYLGFDSVKTERAWDTEIIDLLTISGQMFAGLMIRKLTEQMLQESEERHRTLLEHTNDLIVETDSLGKVLYVSPNHKELLGYEPDELIGKSIFEFIHPDDHESTLAEFKEAINKFESRHVVHRLKHIDGKWRWFESAGKPFKTASGEIRTVIASRDITERIKAEQDLKNALSEVEMLKNRLEAENVYLQEEIKTEYNFDEIIGKSKELKMVLRTVEQVAPTDTTVLITGETGTGKELVARSIHNLSPRKNRPLVKVNCGAIPEGLVESELFGHEKGSFTGAVQQRAGRFELADGGTIFLDELSELPIDIQVKLLRVLQEGEFERVGGTQTKKVDVRIIAATNRNLEKAMDDGKFRSDLYYRLNVFPIHVPSLRERVEDIEHLVNHFVDKFSRKAGKSIKSISKEALEKIKNYNWPGNIRELENIIERAVILSRGDSITLKDLPDIDNRNNQTNFDSHDKSIKTLEDLERTHILEILEECKWIVDGNRGAAKILNINPSTLRSRMKKLGINK